MRILVSLLCLVFLAGCAHKRAKTAKRAQQELVGLTKDEVLQCAGAPARIAAAGRVEVLTYLGGGDARGVAVTNSNVTTMSVQRRYCEVSFVLRDGVVDRVNYAGRTGGLATRGEQCAFVVQGCLQEFGDPR